MVKIKDKSFFGSLKPLGKYLDSHRRMFLIGLACVFLTNSLGMVVPLIIKRAIDAIEAHQSTIVVLSSVAALIGLKLIQSTFRFLMRQILIGISRKIEYKIRTDLFEHLQTLPLSFYQHWRIGDLMSRATNDLNEVRMLLGPAIMYSFQTAVTIAFALPVMVYIDLKLTLLSLLPLALMALSYKKVGRIIHDRSMAVQKKLSDISAKVQENLAGIRVIKSFTREDNEIEQFEKLNHEYLQRNMSLVKVSGILYPLMAFLAGLSSLVILGYGGLLVTRRVLTLGDFTAFFLYLGMMSWPMIAVGFVLNVIQRGRASLGRIMELFEKKSDIADPVQPSPILSGKRLAEGSIAFRNLTFAYPGTEEPALYEISIEIPSGSTFAMVGPVGSGKSTLLNLIPRLYNPPRGRLLIDGADVLDWPLELLRRSISMVPQDTFLFSESIRENILWGRQHPVEEEEILEIVKTAGLDDDVESFPDKLDTLLGERGINLSGGQKQRTSIGRALMVDPAILLLDDCFSSVDTGTEEKILRSLRKFLKNRTAVIVSHRISTIKFADQIVVLEQGRITQTGSHEELLQLPGYYSSLYEKQLLEEKIERIT
ncbi:MAG TPA: ABC transporter ATP-binding protein [archaeon]|nr:ABC transporter ATP-binding protein [archaeon]